MKFKLLQIWALCFFSTLLMLSCNKGEIIDLDFPPKAKSGYLDLEPEIYTFKKIKYASEKGIIVVPENRDDSNSRVITLPIRRVFATKENPKAPIFILNGGPGMSNMKFKYFEGLIQNHDIVMVGYRGVDGSVVLKCPEVDKFFCDVPGDLTEQSTIDKLAEAYADCASRLQSEGVDIGGYNMLSVIHDIEDARNALGYDKINFLSQSYGTRLAMIYSWIYPQNIERSAMISVNPPGHFVWYPEVIDEQLEYYSSLCKKDNGCSDRAKDLVLTIRNAQQSMPKSWGFFPIKKGNVLIGTFMMLYHTNSAAKVFDAWISAEKGDWSGIAMLSMAIDYMMKGASEWGESAAKAMIDYQFDPSVDPLELLMPSESIIGAPASILGIAATKGWPSNMLPDSLQNVQQSEVPTLMICGNIDFSTPAQFARDKLLPYLSNGRQVILSEFGHTGDVWEKQHEATIHLLKTYFESGRVDDSKFEYAPMNFNAGLGYPTMMKLGLAIGFLIFILLGFVLWLVIQKIRKRNKTK